MSNNWHQPPTGQQPGGNNNGQYNGMPHQTGNLPPGQNPQQPPSPPVKQFSPMRMPSRQLEPLAYGPPQTNEQNAGQMPVPVPGQMSPQRGLLSAARGQGLFGNAVQMVRRFSGKIVAINRQGMDAPPEPLTRYNPPMNNPNVRPSGPLPKAKPWKRSTTVRLAMRMRHRRVYAHGGRKRVGIGVLVALIALIIISASSGSAYGYAYYQSQQPQLQQIASKQVSQITRIYDRNNVLLAQVYDNVNGHGRRISVSYDQIPQVMLDAMVAAEDPTFWNNNGVDPQGLLRAAVYGGAHGGGSTITQQLIKNIRNDGSQITVTRKLSEGALAIGMTQQYPKQKILEMYLNISPFGATDLGVESASEDYFGLSEQCNKNFACTPAISQLDYNPATKKHDAMLALARASFLAAIPNNPSIFDPGTWAASPENKDLALARQAYVLGAMSGMGTLVAGLGPNGQAGPITESIALQVENMTRAMTFGSYHAGWKDPHFVGWIIGQLEAALGNGDTDAGATLLMNGGFNIRTTIDSNLETYVEKAVARHLTQSELQKITGVYATLNSETYNVNDAAVVVMNAKTGEVLAMDGSSNYGSTDKRVSGQVNVATSPRQPGSTFKPIVYSTAFEMGWNASIVLPDVPTYFPQGYGPGTPMDKTYKPTDYGNTYHFDMTASIRHSTANSFNVPALRALTFAGPSNVVATALRMGINIDPAVKNTSLALGTTEVSLLQMVDAYQTFANNGLHSSSQGILDIWDNYGHNFYHFDPNHVQSSQVITPQISYMMTSVLDDEASRVTEFGSDHDLSFWDWDTTCSYQQQCQQHQVAAKTGTTDDFRDNWAIGYTPDVVVGVWTGNANDEPFGKIVIGITGAAPIWHSVIERVSGRCNVDTDQIPCGNINLGALGLGNQTLFTQPPGIHQACANKVNGLKGTGGACDWVLDGQDPVQTGILPGADKNKDGKGNNNGGGNNNGTGNGNGG